MASRIDKITQTVKKELSDIIQNKLKDPRIPNLVSVVSVNVTGDMREATCYVSVFGTQEEKDKCMEALTAAQGFIRKELGTRLNIRYTPKVTFRIDDSMEHGAHMNELFKKIHQEKSEQ